MPSNIYGGVAEWSNAADCKSALLEYVGSNPTPTTIFKMPGFAGLFYVLKLFLYLINLEVETWQFFDMNAILAETSPGSKRRILEYQGSREIDYIW